MDNWAWIFPGQGSQSVGMGHWLYKEFPKVRTLFEEASDLLSFHFKKLLFEGPEETLALTQNTQPALVLVSEAYATVLKERGLDKNLKATSGHSVGEYGALVSAHVFSFKEALLAVEKRAQAMNQAVKETQGGMLAVLKQPLKRVKTLAQEFDLECANFNTPEQVVLSGWRDNIKKLMTSLEDKEKVYFRPLKVSAPFHCSLMKPAQDAMVSVLEAIEFQKARVPVVQNRTAQGETQPEVLKKNLIEQISAPVLWTDCMKQLYNFNISHVIEMGQGKVLKGLLKKIQPEIKTYNFQCLEDFKNFEKEMNL